MTDLNLFMQKASYRPKERVLLIVHNSVNESRTGKSILTDAQKTAIAGDGWHPKDNYEVREFNRYNEAWKYEGYMKLDAQTTYLNAQISLLEASRLVYYVLYTSDKNVMERFKKIGPEEYYDEALELVLQNTELVFDRVVYKLAFQSLSDDLRHDILALCPDAETESEYLDHEEALAQLFDGKDALTPGAKDRLVEMINVPYTKYAKALVSYGLPTKDFLLQGFFAELPIINIGKKWADDHGIICEEYELAEKLEQYAAGRKTTAQDVLKTTLRKWLDEGLFVTDYLPVWNSAITATCNNVDTKLPHSEVLKGWLKAKGEARTTLQKLVDDGKLAVEIREKTTFGIAEELRVLTGESVYRLEDGSRLAEDLKKQVGGLMPFGYLISFLRKRSFLDGYASLLGVADIYKRLSPIYEIDLGYKVDTFIEELKKSIGGTNADLRRIAEKLEEANHLKHGIVFSAETFFEDALFRLDDIKPLMDESAIRYTEEFEKTLGKEFGSSGE